MAAGGEGEHVLFDACLEAFQLAQAHAAPAEGEEFPGLDWQGWEEIAAALGIQDSVDAPVFRSRQAVKIAVAADAANLAGERVKFGAVEQRLTDILSGGASLSQVPDTQAEEALLRPARARVVLRERRRRSGRTNKTDIYYQVLFDGHPEEDGAWLSQGQLRKHFPDSWQQMVEEFNQRAKSGTLLEPSPADAGAGAAAAAAAGGAQQGKGAPSQRGWQPQTAALLAAAQQALNSAPAKSGGKRLGTGARPLAPPAAAAELPVLPRNIPLDSQPDDQPVLFGKAGAPPPPSALLAGLKLLPQQPAPRPVPQAAPRPPQPPAARPAQQPGARPQQPPMPAGQPAAAAALWAGYQGPIVPLTCTGPPPRPAGSFGPPPQMAQQAQQQWRPQQAAQAPPPQQVQQQQWQQQQQQQQQQASASMSPQTSQLSARNLLGRAFQRQRAVDSGPGYGRPPGVPAPQPPPGFGAGVPPPMPPPGYAQLAASGHGRVPPPLPPPGYQQPIITPAASPLRSPQRRPGSPLIAAAHAARGGYVFAGQRLSASPAAAASVRSGGASILDAYRRKRALQSTASPARQQQRGGQGGSPAGAQAEQPRARVPPPLPPPGWTAGQPPLSPEQPRLRVPPPLPPGGWPAQQQGAAGQAAGRAPAPLPPPGWQPAGHPAAAFAEQAAPAGQQQQAPGAGEHSTGGTRRPREEGAAAVASGGSADAQQPAAKRARQGRLALAAAVAAEAPGNAAVAAPQQQGMPSPVRQAGAVAAPQLAAGQPHHRQQAAGGWEEPTDASDLAFRQALPMLAGMGGLKAPSPCKLDPQGQLMSPSAAAAAAALAAEAAAAEAEAAQAVPAAAGAAAGAAAEARDAAAVNDTPADDEFFDAREELADGSQQLQGSDSDEPSAQQEEDGPAAAGAAAAAAGGAAADGGGLPAAVLDLRTQPDEIQWTNLHDEPVDSLPATQVVQGAASSGRQAHVVVVPETEDQVAAAAATTAAQQQQPRQQQSVGAAAAAAVDEAVAAAEQAQARQQRQLAREQRRQAQEQAQQAQQGSGQAPLVGSRGEEGGQEGAEEVAEAAAEKEDAEEEDSRAEAALLLFVTHLQDAEIRGAKSTPHGVDLFYEWPSGVQEVVPSSKLLSIAQEAWAGPFCRELAKVAQFYESKTRRSKEGQKKRGR